MRGARPTLAALWLGVLAACAVSEPPVAAPPAPEPAAADAAPGKPWNPAQDNVVFRTGPLPDASGEAQGSRIKGGAPEDNDRTPAPAVSRPNELLAIQQKIVARDPGRDEEKFLLALLHAAAGEFEDADLILSSLHAPTNKLAPALEYVVRRQLGDHQDARRILDQFNEEEKRVTGFVIGDAQLCSKIRRYRDYTAAEDNHVRPGGSVILYVEPRNFTLQHLQDKYILHLKYDWRLYDDRSTEHPVPAWEAAAPNDREDRNTYTGVVDEFYQSFTLPLPANLAMGHHRIKVTVTDAPTGRNDRTYIPIYVDAVEAGR